ncbi:META domain-containing protein [Nostoc sp. UHCC 0702]|nr:META domain-containing protein [Nostoc sp. UHCC 0702]
MNIFKDIKKAIVFGLALFCLALAFQSPSYAAGLKGNWQLESLGGAPVLEKTQITAEFENDFHGSISGSGGCNRYVASFTANSGRITVGSNMIATPILCSPESIMQQERKYFDALQSATSYDVSDQNLKLTYGSDKKLLEYVKAE